MFPVTTPEVPPARAIRYTRVAFAIVAAGAAFALYFASRPAHNYLDGAGPRYAVDLPPAPDPTPELKVVTFNVQYARDIPNALAALREEEGLAGADIIALQEMDAPGAEAIARGLGMSAVYYPASVHPRDGRDFGNAVLVRGRILKDRKVILPHPSILRGMQRIAVAADVEVQGAHMRVYSVHLSAPTDVTPSSRRDQVARLVEDARGAERVVMAGDFNDRDLVGDAFEGAGYTWASRGLPFTISRFTWDHVFVRGLTGVSVERRGVANGRGASNHLPVWVDLQLPAPASPAPSPVPAVSTAPRRSTTPAP